MRKADIILEIHHKTGIPKVDILVILEHYFQEVKQAVLEGEVVAARGFGTFTTQLRNQKKARDIRAKTEVFVPEHYIPKFKPSKEFMDAMRTIKVRRV
ncbi:MAG: HU family DNA-binding protein [Bacteroidota bacterium]